MRRPTIGVFLLATLVGAGCVTTRPTATRCRQDQACWPTPADWQGLAASLTGKLEQPRSPLASCRADAASEACAKELEDLKNPFALQDQSGATQSMGWLGAWTAEPSAYAVAAETAQDVVAAVNFAREHQLRLVIKGTGHDYLGRSSAPDSLLVWTHKMRDTTIDDAFVPHGCPAGHPAVTTVSVGAGTRWVEAYREVSVKHGRYVQGGGCTSVGAAGGFIQGGGFGSWSNKFGIAAAGIVEAEVVTADGRLLIANACQNEDLFWALRGGGGGTFGVVTRLTLLTHPAPSYLGFVVGKITAKSDAAFQRLLEQLVAFYDESLSNEVWGEKIFIKGDNTIEVSLSFQGIDGKGAEQIWKPFRAWAEPQPDLAVELNTLAIPSAKVWDVEFLQKYAADNVKVDTRPGEPGSLFWWAANQGEVATYWYAYMSRWLPRSAFRPPRAKAFAQALFAASRKWGLEVAFNKGQASASSAALARDKETSMNPVVYDAAALVIIASDTKAYPGVKGHEADADEGKANQTRVAAAMEIIRAATPGTGSYVNETDYFEPSWQSELWGVNYPRLLEIKHKYDPGRLFTCHHCVGSEE